MSCINTNILHINRNDVLVIDFPDELGKSAIGVNEGKIIEKSFIEATNNRMPIVVNISSVGMKITEGTMALMQMAKIAAAIKQHSDAGLLFISVIKGQTYGGASVCLVALADIIIGVKGAKLGFSGRRIIEHTTKENIDEDFQTVEYGQKFGMIDIIVENNDLIKTIELLIDIHNNSIRYGY